MRDVLRRRVRSRRIFSYSLDEQEPEGRAAGVSDPSLGPDRLAQDAEKESALRLVVDALPERQREAFSLRYFQGLDVDEVARVLGCRKATVKVHIFRAVRRIAIEMEPYARER